jgi:hypothetical protein
MTYENAYYLAVGYAVAMSRYHPIWVAVFMGLGFLLGAATTVWAWHTTSTAWQRHRAERQR